MTFLLKTSAIKQVQSISNNKPLGLKYCAYIAVVLLLYLVWKNLIENADVSFDLLNPSRQVLGSESETAHSRDPNCSYWDCFNVYRCGQQRMLVYVYPMKDYVDENGVKADKFTKEFYYILDTILKSRYYTSNPNEACIFVPSIDTLSQANINTDLVSKALASLP